MNTTKKSTWYVVWVGVTPGIYSSWVECKLQINGYKGARYKSFKDISRAEAEEIYTQGYAAAVAKKRPKPQPKHAVTILPNAIAVDAASSGNPGKVEYRGVEVEGGAVLFASQLYPLGTNNMGEFLAIVHALALMHRQGINRPIYTDSVTALSWVRNKCVKSNLARTPKSALIWLHVDRALAWLLAHDITSYRIIKWPTEILGEIPADYGRK